MDRFLSGRIARLNGKTFKGNHPATRPARRGAVLMEALEPRRLLSGGYLDTTFGIDGLVVAHPTAGFDQYAQVAQQSDGKIIAAGTSFGNDAAGGGDFLVARYNPDGSLDTTFGNDGYVHIDFSGRRDSATAVLIQPDDRIVVAGSTANANTSLSDDVDFAVARLTSNGALDGTFGIGGRQSTNFYGGRDTISALAIDDVDNIVAIGTATQIGGAAGNVAIVRYEPDGTKDNTFGVGGLVTTDIGSITGTGAGTVDSAYDGTICNCNEIIVVGGTLIPGQKGDFFIARYKTNGVLDSSFNGIGVVVTDFGGGEEAHAVAMDSDETHIVVAGRTNVNGSDDVALARYNDDGSLDYFFGQGGKVITDLFSGSADEITSVVVDDNGRAVVAGSTAPAGDANHSLFILARYNHNGDGLDATFGVNGLVTTDAGQGQNTIKSLAIDDDGKLLAAGVVPGNFTTVGGVLVPGSSSAALLRYSGTNLPPILVTGPVAGGPPVVHVLDAQTHQELFTLQPFGNFGGGAAVAAGDVNGDGYPDIIVAAGVGGASHIRVFDGLTGEQISGEMGSFIAYPGAASLDDPNYFTGAFQGVVNIAAGDINHDGHDDIIVAVGADGPPHLKVFSGADGSLLISTLVYPGADSPDDPNYFAGAFLGGVRVASGDVTGDGTDDIVTGANAGAGPHVKVYDGATHDIVQSFFAYDPGYTGGVKVAAGDYDGDGHDDIITSPGVGAGPHVAVFSGANNTLLASFYAYDADYLGSIWTAAADITGDHRAEILAVPAQNAGANIRVFAGGGGTVPTVISDFFAYDPGVTDGAFIAVASAG